MGASGVDTWEKLAERTGYSWSLVKELGKSRPMQRKHWQAIAAACNVPYEWFTVPDLGEAVRIGANTAAGQPGNEAVASQLGGRGAGLRRALRERDSRRA